MLVYQNNLRNIMALAAAINAKLCVGIDLITVGTGLLWHGCPKDYCL